MPQDAYTTEVMKLLPAALRPNPYNLAETAMKAAAKGWSARDLVAAIMADKPREAGHVIAAARRIADTPAPHQPGMTETGPCQQACDRGWHNTMPCPTCRPDTYRRVQLRDQAKARGADHTQLAKIMSEAAPGPVPHTYPVGTYA